MGDAGAHRSKVLLVDDHQVVRSGLKTLLELEEDIVVVGEAGTAQEGIQVAEREAPDLIIMDVRLPDRSGISACSELTSRHPEMKVLVLTSYADDAALASAIAARASGYVLKRVAASDLVSIVRRVLEGEAVFDHDWESSEPDPVLFSLSDQERLIASHISEGLTNREIARRMGLAEKTVKNYVSSVFAKTGMSRRSQVAAYVARVETTEGGVSSPRRAVSD